MGGACSAIGDRAGVYRVLVRKLRERDRPLAKARRRWDDEIKMGLMEVGCGVWAGSS